MKRTPLRRRAPLRGKTKPRRSKPLERAASMAAHGCSAHGGRRPGVHRVRCRSPDRPGAPHPALARRVRRRPLCGAGLPAVPPGLRPRRPGSAAIPRAGVPGAARACRGARRADRGAAEDKRAPGGAGGRSRVGHPSQASRVPSCADGVDPAVCAAAICASSADGGLPPAVVRPRPTPVTTETGAQPEQLCPES